MRQFVRFLALLALISGLSGIGVVAPAFAQTTSSPAAQAPDFDAVVSQCLAATRGASGSQCNANIDALLAGLDGDAYDQMVARLASALVSRSGYQPGARGPDGLVDAMYHLSQVSRNADQAQLVTQIYSAVYNGTDIPTGAITPDTPASPN
ncbi:MAG: hypothetical protein KKH72_00530 [Alphaproteobacteria bacterium]|nr:hypothetical protein [Alphaproteobacteria bacterium]